MKKYLSSAVFLLFLIPGAAFADVCGISNPSPLSELPAIGYPGSGYADQVAAYFIATEDCTITSATAPISVSGSPGDLTGYIYADAGGLPGVQLSSGSSFTPAPGTCAVSTFDVGSASLVHGHKYWLSLLASAPADGGNHYGWCGHGSLSNASAFYDGVSWSGNVDVLGLEIDGTNFSSYARFNAMIDNSTSSVENVTGFGMGSMGSWMWENLAKPIFGTGLGVLYTIRWQIIVIISLFIIIYFAVRYYGFFKN